MTLSNNNGGINGGITNGMPIVFRTVIKPTSSIARTQKTVNLETRENAELAIKGRHDPCVLMRAAPVVNAAVALVLSDLIATHEGTNCFCVKK